MTETETTTPTAEAPDGPGQALEAPSQQPGLPPAIMSDDEIRRTWRVAEALAKSGLFKDATKAGQAFAKVLAGRDLGLTPFEAMGQLHVIEGKIEASSDLHATKVRQREGYDYRVAWIKAEGEGDDPTAGDRSVVWADEDDASDLREIVGCAIEFTVGGEKRGVSRWTLEDSKRANLERDRGTKPSLHVTYPRSMYFARAMTNGVAWYVPDVMGGLRVYSPGEIPREGAIDGDPSGGGVGLGGDEMTMAQVPWPLDQVLKDEMRDVIEQINVLDPNRYSPPTLQMLLGGRSMQQHVEILEGLKAEHRRLREKVAAEQAADEEQVEDAVVVEDEPREGDEDRGGEPREGDDTSAAADDAEPVASDEQRLTYLRARLADVKRTLESGTAPDGTPLSEEQVAECEREIDYAETEIAKITGDDPPAGQESMELE